MVKATNPWLRSLLRAGKKQQRTVARSLTGLLKAATPLAPPKRKKAVAKTPLQPPRVAAKTARAPRPPAAAPPANGKWLADHYSGVGEQGVSKRMSYWLYVPDSAAPSGAGMPLLVMLHGCKQSATLFAQGTRMNQLAEKAGYAVVYPQQSVTSHPHRCWKWYDRTTQQGGGDVGLIVGIVHQVRARYPIDLSRIYICGISAGAGMAHIVALNHPELFAGLGLHSGPMFGGGHSQVGALAVMRHGGQPAGAITALLEKQPGFPGMPTMLIQGEKDPVVHPVNQLQLEQQVMQLNQLPAGSPVKTMRKPGSRRGHPYQLHDVYRGRKVMLRVARIAELQHAWSGGDESVSFNSAAGPDASKMLLAFFSRHRRLPAPRGGSTPGR